MKSDKIELLAPSGNLSIGRAAIDAGADAVYIGGPSFSARAASTNSIEDIAELCRYAHLFGARVYLAINTLLFEEEFAAAREMVIEAHAAGVDAFIVQDMAFLAMDLPPKIVLHASTQCANRTQERVAELQEAGFARVVLERGLSIAEIRAIAQNTDVELEAFVHGAICVSYSGECYLSERLCAPRSANRGSCAQPCRSLYDLVDADGKVLLKNEPLLSPKDLNLSNRLAELIEAGVTSLKIEGRLKDERYVVNTVAYYNEKLREQGVERSSYGVSRPHFTPDPERTFTRGFTEYFFDGRQKNLLTVREPKGKYIGVIKTLSEKCFTLDRVHELENGDGIVTDKGQGVRVNRVDGIQIFPLTTDSLAVGDRVYCNFFKNFEPRSTRKIAVSIELTDSSLVLQDIYGHSFALQLPTGLQVAANEAKARETLLKNLAKSGDTIFEVEMVSLACSVLPFIPIAQINELRRSLFALYHLPRVDHLRAAPTKDRLPQNTLPSAVLVTPLCPLYQYGICLKQTALTLPLTLINNGRRISFEPSCGECRLYLR